MVTPPRAADRRLGRQVLVEGLRVAEVRVRVDDTRHDDQAGGVDLLVRGGSLTRGQDGGDPAVLDAQAALQRSPVRVDEQATRDSDIEVHETSLHGWACGDRDPRPPPRPPGWFTQRTASSFLTRVRSVSMPRPDTRDPKARLRGPRRPRRL